MHLSVWYVGSTVMLMLRSKTQHKRRLHATWSEQWNLFCSADRRTSKSNPIKLTSDNFHQNTGLRKLSKCISIVNNLNAWKLKRGPAETLNKWPWCRYVASVAVCVWLHPANRHRGRKSIEHANHTTWPHHGRTRSTVYITQSASFCRVFTRYDIKAGYSSSF